MKNNKNLIKIKKEKDNIKGKWLKTSGKVKLSDSVYVDENWRALGFTAKQWKNSIWVSAIENYTPYPTEGFWIYAKRKGDKYKKLWIGIDDPKRKIAVLKSLDMSVKEWKKTTQDERQKIFAPLIKEFYEKYWKWEVKIL